MELTPLQLEIQKLGADKSLNLGCIVIDKTHQFFGKNVPEFMIIVSDRPDFYEDDGIDLLHYRGNPTVKIPLEDINNTDECEIIGHPITYSRLCYHFHKTKNIVRSFDKIKLIDDAMYNLDVYMILNIELYNQSVLERPEELQLLVRDFLLSIQ